MKNKSKVSNTTTARVVSEILSQSDPSEIFGTEGIFQEFKKQMGYSDIDNTICVIKLAQNASIALSK